MDKKYIIGTLIVLILASAIYVTLPGKVKLRVDDDKTTLYNLQESRWRVIGREYNKLYDWPSLMNRDLSQTYIDYNLSEINQKTTITRITTYQRGPVIKDTYLFDGKSVDIEMVPVYHTVEIFNGAGYIYQYEVRDLSYNGVTQKVYDTSMSFGNNVKVTWDDSYYWATVYESGILKVRYKLDSDYEKFDVRLYDPILGNSTLNVSYSTYNNTNLSFPPVWTMINWSNIVNISTGNYSWNLTENNITAYRMPDYTYYILNNGTKMVTIKAKMNQSKEEWFDLWILNGTIKQWNLSEDWTDLFNLSAGNSSYLNVTLDLNNISRVYVNFSISEDRANWTDDIILNATEVS